LQTGKQVHKTAEIWPAYVYKIAEMRSEAKPRQRRYARIAIPKGLYVAWQAARGRSVSRVSTIGLGGVFIETPHPAARGEMLRLVFDVPGGEVRALGVVRDTQPGRGMGVEFTVMPPEARSRLSQFMARLLRL
jgi:PilZ domain